VDIKSTDGAWQFDALLTCLANLASLLLGGLGVLLPTTQARLGLATSNSVVRQKSWARLRTLTARAQVAHSAWLASEGRQLHEDLTGIRKVLMAAILTPLVATTASRSVGFGMSDGKSGTFTISITGHITLTDDDVRRVLAEAMP
jgi:hypothetical protein